MAAVRGEDEAEREVCGLVAVVTSLMYLSTLAMNSGIWSWWKRENKSS